MPTVRIPDSVSSIPPKSKTAIRRGFEQFRLLDSTQKKYAYDLAPRILRSPSQLEESEIARTLHLQEESASDLMATLSFAAVLIATSMESAEYLLQVAIEARAIEADSRSAGLELIEGLIGERRDLERAVKVAQLAQEVLPSLLGIHSTVDLRASFIGDQIGYTVPTIIMTLRVDIGVAREITFQLTQDEAISMRDRLNVEIRRAELLSSWAEGKADGSPTDPILK